jgi:hypothetical protein
MKRPVVFIFLISLLSAQMTFATLSSAAQIALSFAMVDLLKKCPADLFPPVLTPGEWFSVFTSMNPQLGRDGLPTNAELVRAVEYAESSLGAPGECENCGANF